jgi:hypothetical protein
LCNDTHVNLEGIGSIGADGSARVNEAVEMALRQDANDIESA